jgi:hypothetical protein
MLAVTAKKLGVSFFRYPHDRISAENQIPPLADLKDEYTDCQDLRDG